MASSCPTTGARLRILTIAAVLAGEAALAAVLVMGTPAPANAQFFWEQGGRRRFDWFDRQPEPEQRREAPADYSRAPAPKKADPKAEAAVTMPILVLGDSMADWLGYGLEQTYADAPEIGILRRHKTNSGLIRTETKSDPRGEYPDWPQAARELIATTKPKFVLIMLGINDRRQFREVTQAAPRPAPKPAPAPSPAASQGTQGQEGTDEDKQLAGEEKPQAATPPPPPAPAPAPAAPVVRNLEFHSDAWSEAYSRRIDETIAALKTSGVPVFWVGLPPLKGQKAAVDIPYLNDLYRSRADKAGIIYIDVWDGFVGEDGNYVQYGPDVEGQTRRLRTGDGAYFTQYGAKKLAHYVQREIQRWMSNRPVALAVPEEPKETRADTKDTKETVPAAKSGPHARPLSGPAVALTAERAVDSDDLAGGGNRPPPGDAIAAKVLVQGEAVPAPAGRADDFTWPRRGVAPVGSDPVVAATELPMTPMVAERGGAATVATASPEQPAGASSAAGTQSPKPVVAVRRPRPASSYADMQQQGIYRPDYRRPQQPVQPQPWSFNSLFGSPSWYRR
jgi:uncharacterized protein